MFVLHENFVSNDQFCLLQQFKQMKLANEIANKFQKNFERNFETKMRNCFIEQKQCRNFEKNNVKYDFF